MKQNISPSRNDTYSLYITSFYSHDSFCNASFYLETQAETEVRVARIFNTFGPRMHPNDGRVVSNFIIQCIQGKDITIYGEQGGSGKEAQSRCVRTCDEGGKNRQRLR